VIIDMHAHIADLRTLDGLHHQPPSAASLVARLDDEGIDRAAVLPWSACSEAVTFPSLFTPHPDIVGQLRDAARYPERLILFGNADPRWGGNAADTDYAWLLERLVEMGCVGMGEVSAYIPFDDPRTVNLFRQCGQWELPVTIESTREGPRWERYGFIDEPGLPHLERLLQLAPETTVIGHGPGFWADMGDGPDGTATYPYPPGPITEEGAVPRLLRRYPRLYADLSAGSGYTAITRDEAFGVAFLAEFQDKLLFGTDDCHAADEVERTPQLGHLRALRNAGRLSQTAYAKITYRNALRIMPRYRIESGTSADGR
jgi:predicted TIM-barrel fold metal-dependent hydrolase